MKHASNVKTTIKQKNLKLYKVFRKDWNWILFINTESVRIVKLFLNTEGEGGGNVKLIIFMKLKNSCRNYYILREFAISFFLFTFIQFIGKSIDLNSK